MEIRAILFDLDGTLVDSERESAEAIARVLQRDLGLRMSAQAREYVVGHSWIEIYAFLQEQHGLALSWPLPELIARAGAERVKIFAEVGMTIMPGAREAVLRLARFPRAIVTGSSRAEAGESLRYLGLEAEFAHVIVAEDYARGKPAPDGYLMAAERLAMPPAACLVVEDSAAGIAAGRAAGMKVLAVRAGNFLGKDQSAAHRVVDTLHDLTDALLRDLA